MTIELTTLESGLRVVTDTMRELETASVGVWIDAGARTESADEQGLSHLLEHMVFKGTRRRSAKAIAEEIEAVGGDLNGATSVEHTSYQARVLAADVGLAMDMLGDILTDSVFDRKELDREKNVIVQEIGEAHDIPDDIVFDMFNEAAWPGQPIGRPILGTPEGVSGFSRSRVASYLGRNYTKSTTVIAAAGAVEHGKIVEQASAHFSAMPTHERPAPAPARYLGGDAREKRRLEQTHVVIGFEAPSFHDPSTWAAHVFASAAGGGVSSRLFQEVREKRGLAYSIYSFNWAYSDTGLFGFHASSAHRDVPELVDVALDCLAQCGETLNEAEARRASAAMKLSLLTALESPSSRADQIARQVMVFGRVLTRQEIIEKIDNLTLKEIRAAGRASLHSPPTVSVVGQTAKAPDATRVREMLRERDLAMALFRLGPATDNANFIRGDGVYLRPAEMRDFDQWARLRERSREFLVPWEPTWPADDLTRASFRRRLRRHAEEIDNDEAYPFLIFREGDNTLLGGLTLGQIRRGVAQAATLGYWMGEPWAGKGLMGRAVRAAASFGFATLRLHRIEAACLPHNAASVRLLERVGFQREGFARAYLRINGAWRDHLLFALLESDPVSAPGPSRR